jgi:NAD(P)-dependent dehydrogenase (short-subunit alcohol dehydrogenase family)
MMTDFTSHVALCRALLPHMQEQAGSAQIINVSALAGADRQRGERKRVSDERRTERQRGRATERQRDSETARQRDKKKEIQRHFKCVNDVCVCVCVYMCAY